MRFQTLESVDLDHVVGGNDQEKARAAYCATNREAAFCPKPKPAPTIADRSGPSPDIRFELDGLGASPPVASPPAPDKKDCGLLGVRCWF